MRWVALTFALLAGGIVTGPARGEISLLTRADVPVGPAPTDFAVTRNGSQIVVADDQGLAVYRLERGDVSLAERLPGVAFVKSFAVGDLNGDGTADLAATDGISPLIRVYYGRSTGAFSDPVDVPVPTRVRVVKAVPRKPGAAASLILVHDDNVSIMAREEGSRFRETGRIDATVPSDVAFIDADDDGSLDLVVADEAANALSVVSSTRPDGSEKNERVEVRSIERPQRVSAVDVDGDGREDVIVLGLDGVAVQRRTGPLKFGPPEWVWRSPHITDVVSGDLNRDGRLDIVAVNRKRGTVTVLLGQGDGKFARYESYATGRAPVAVSLSDTSGDGVPDALVLNNLDNSITALRGRPNGTFEGSPVVLTDNDDLAAIAVTDFNADGRADLAVASETGGTLTILLGDGAGHFTESWSQEVGQRPRALVAGNFDLDAFPDVAVANFGSDSVTILLGNGRGGFEVPTVIPVGFGPTSIVSGSLQDEEHVDLAVANSLSDNASVLLNDGRGRFHDVVNYPVVQRPTYLMIGDLNQDGHPDLVAGSDYNETVTVLYGDGRALGNPQPNKLASTARTLVSDDFDGDGHLDLVVTNNRSNSVEILPGVAGGSFGSKLAFPVGYHPDAAATGDFNGDGRPDIAVVHVETGTVAILLNTTRPPSPPADKRAAKKHP